MSAALPANLPRSAIETERTLLNFKYLLTCYTYLVISYLQEVGKESDACNSRTRQCWQDSHREDPSGWSVLNEKPICSNFSRL